MSSRVAKSRSRQKVVSRDRLILTIVCNAVEMPAACSACSRNHRPCLASSDSSRCVDCVSRNLGSCDRAGPSERQLESLTRQFQISEADLDAAEEEAEEVRLRAERDIAAANAKVRRLRKQRKMWADRVARMVRRGLTSLEELDRVEAEEASGGAPVPVATVEPVPALDFSLMSDSEFAALGFDFPVDISGASVDSLSNA